MSGAEAWRSAGNVLAVRLDGMGDMLMSTPALLALKEAVPGRRLGVLASPAGARIARHLPFVDEVIEFAAPWMKHPGLRHAAARSMALLGTLRARRFDAAVILTVFSQSPLPAAGMLLLAEIPLRAAHCRENPYDLLTHWQPEPDLDVHAGVRHEVQRQLDLCAALGAPARDTRLQFAVTDAARETLAARLRAEGVEPGQRFVVLHPGASAASRRYPPECYGRAAARLATEDGWRIVLAGSEDDRAAATLIRAHVPAAASLAGALDIGELAALLEAAAVVVANNSVAAHLAAAVGTPVCDLYALTNPQHTPWGVAHRVLNHDVECRFCFKSTCPRHHHRCLAGVAPDEVVDAVRELTAAGVADAVAASAPAGTASGACLAVAA